MEQSLNFICSFLYEPCLCMERSSSGQEPTHLPRWEEVARRKPSERQVDTVLCAGAAAHGAERGLNFIVFEILPGIGWRADYMQPLLLRSIHEDTS